MLFLKFSLIFLTLFSQIAWGQKFSTEQCLEANFDTEINHEEKFFGLIKNKLKVNKKECIFDISFKNILETSWKVDVCREPIHMKVTSKGSQTVHKRDKGCSGKKTDYCSYWDDLLETIQDYGLIFAKGDREDLSSDHGETYCTYLLLKKYLGEGQLFSKYEKNPNLFEPEPIQKKETTIESIEVVKERSEPDEEINIEKKSEVIIEETYENPVEKEEQEETEIEDEPKIQF